jgi:hypothetical protein
MQPLKDPGQTSTRCDTHLGHQGPRLLSFLFRAAPMMLSLTRRALARVDRAENALVSKS